MKRIFYAPDAGGGGAAPAPSPMQTTPTPSAEPSTAPAQPESAPAGAGASATEPATEDDDPYKGTWLSQLSKDTRDKHKERLEGIKGKHIGEVLDEYFANSETLDKRAIVFPGKDAKPEEIDSFLKKMDIPKNTEEYGFDPKNMPADKDGAFSKLFAEQCLKSGLTRKQGAQLYNSFAVFAKAGIEGQEAKRKEEAGSFEARLAEEHSGNEKATKETQEWYKRFMIGAGKGVVKDLMNSGLAYNTAFARHIATVQKAAMDEPPFPRGGHAGKEQKGGFAYNPEVMEKYRR